MNTLLHLPIVAPTNSGKTTGVKLLMSQLADAVYVQYEEYTSRKLSELLRLHNVVIIDNVPPSSQKMVNAIQQFQQGNDYHTTVLITVSTRKPKFSTSP